VRRANPQRARAVLIKRLDARAPQPQRVSDVEERELGAIEAHQPAVGREPEITIARLVDGHDGVLGQAGFGRPDVDAVLSRNGGGKQKGDEACAEQHRDGDRHGVFSPTGGGEPESLSPWQKKSVPQARSPSKQRRQNCRTIPSRAAR
jgi:hypothetical protein